MAKIILNGCFKAVGHGPQPLGLAIHQAWKKAKEEEILLPYAVRKSTYYREYIVSRDGVDIDTFPRKTDAVAWILKQKENASTEIRKKSDLTVWEEILQTRGA